MEQIMEQIMERIIILQGEAIESVTENVYTKRTNINKSVTQSETIKA